MKNKTVVVLLSGGMDSTVVLADAIAEFGATEVLAVSFSYGQKHDSEIENAKRIAAYYNVEHIILTVDNQVFAGSDSSLLSGSEKEIKKGSYVDELEESADGIVETYVPFRNGLMISQAAAVAFSRKAKQVRYGAHSDDYAGSAYPDCSPEFYAAMDEAIYAGTGKEVCLAAPLLKLNKSEVAGLGIKLGAPLHMTRSCYESSEASCGECATCVDRLKAFSDNHVTDSIDYLIELPDNGYPSYAEVWSNRGFKEMGGSI